MVGSILVCAAAILVVAVSSSPLQSDNELKIEIYINDELETTVRQFDTSEKIFVGIFMSNGKLNAVEHASTLEALKNKLARYKTISQNIHYSITLNIYIGDVMKKTVQNSADGDFIFIIGAENNDIIFTTSESSSVSVFRSSDMNGSGFFHHNSYTSSSSSSSSPSGHGSHVGFIDKNKIFDMIKFPKIFPFTSTGDNNDNSEGSNPFETDSFPFHRPMHNTLKPLVNIDFPDTFPFVHRKHKSEKFEEKKSSMEFPYDFPFNIDGFENPTLALPPPVPLPPFSNHLIPLPTSFNHPPPPPPPPKLLLL